MNRAIISQRITSILAEIERLNNALYAMNTTDIQRYTCDFPRIRRFDTALELHGMTGTLICFDYQEEALREICGQCVMLQSIDFQQFERSVLYS